MLAARVAPWALLVVLGGLAVATSGPRGDPGHGALDRFDGARAVAAMDAVIGRPAVPRPVGSPAHRATRRRLVEALRGLGLEPEVLVDEGCVGERCMSVHNVFAELEPGREGPLSLLMAHYDSVPTGPGVGDDGAALGSILEAIEVVQRRGPSAHPLAVLVTDAEERGLFGARAFVADRRMGRVRSVVNLEARGTSGQSYLFQTSQPNGRITRIAHAAAPRLRASSLFVEVYRRMPNDTDLTVFLDHPVAALNFAFLGGGEHYHTPLDNRANLDVGSVHMQGHQATEAWWALAQADGDLASGGDDVYADVLGLLELRWPVWAAPWVALSVLASVLGLGVVGWSRLHAPARWLGVWGSVGLAGLAVSVWVPGASYLFVAPAAGAVGAAALGAGLGRGWLGSLGGGIVGGLLWLELAVQLPVALGWHPLVVGPPLLIAIGMVVPALPKRERAGYTRALGVR